ncbi:MAG: nitroreductase family protein [Proteobacteria bacterium]|nr:nitroreductase family protein [Pseudomonadota bacterium]
MSGKSTIEDISRDWTETERVILSRRSVRNFKQEQVPEFMVRRVLEAGRFAPSAGNCQPWRFVVLRDRQLIDELTETVVRRCRIIRAMVDYRRPRFQWLRPLANLLIRLKPNDLHPVPFGAISLIGQGRLGLYHGAPTVIMIFKDRRGISNPDLDCGIAGQNMALAAHSMGLGTCWVGFTKLAFLYASRWKERLGVRYPYRFASSLAVGWPVGRPDGMVPRQTHPVDWYENGTQITIT